MIQTKLVLPTQVNPSPSKCNDVLSEKGGVMSDLRTGMLNRTAIGPHEWALLWYANLP
ncbi:MAG: hypothetical protein VSS75_015050 [Candidatus Parabeggiatoa sp.]|nr:hypothetical protein [Candidatus Parabeggiatoa sp.]